MIFFGFAGCSDVVEAQAVSKQDKATAEINDFTFIIHDLKIQIAAKYTEVIINLYFSGRFFAVAN